MTREWDAVKMDRGKLVPLVGSPLRIWCTCETLVENSYFGVPLEIYVKDVTRKNIAGSREWPLGYLVSINITIT